MQSDLLPIPHFPGYFADRQGRVWSTKVKVRGSGCVGGWTHGAPRLMRPHSDTYGYPRVRMMHESRGGRPVLLSRAVAAAFHGEMPEGLQAAHLNGDKWDNRPENLAYVTAKVNIQHRDLHGRTVRGDKSPLAKKTDEEWRQIIREANAGSPIKNLAEKYGVGLSSIYLVRNGSSRRHLFPSIGEHP
jgi:hypothetical protein